MKKIYLAEWLGGSFRKATITCLLGIGVMIGLLNEGCNSHVQAVSSKTRRTVVSIRDDMFYINDRPTYEGRHWKGLKIAGFLLNTRMVQGIFDDLNPATRDLWRYPDTGNWDPERNTRDFTKAMQEWRKNGLLAFTMNLQGGAPRAMEIRSGSIPPMTVSATSGRTILPGSIRS